jgi:hypothetical protein
VGLGSQQSVLLEFYGKIQKTLYQQKVRHLAGKAWSKEVLKGKDTITKQMSI